MKLKSTGKYWDGTANVDLPEGAKEKEAGAFSPEFPTTDDPGGVLKAAAVKAFVEKVHYTGNV